MYFLAGWLPDGMPFLCINTGRAGTKPDTVRDVKTGLPDPEGAVSVTYIFKNRRAWHRQRAIWHKRHIFSLEAE